MTKLEIMKSNKKLYTAVLEETEKMGMSFEWAVKEFIILPWIRGNNWMGGISDSKFQKASDKIKDMFCCDDTDIYREATKQMRTYLGGD